MALVALLSIAAVMLLVIPERQYCETPKDSTHQYCSLHNALSVMLFNLSDFFSDFGAAITGLATIAIAAFTATLWWTSKATLQHLARQFDAEQRPWIPAKVEIAGSWRRSEGSDGAVTLKFVLRNVGRTPAINVNVWLAMHLVYGLDDTPERQRRMYEQEQTKPIPKGKGAGVTIFPKQEQVEQIHAVTLAAGAFDDFRNWMKQAHGTDYMGPALPVIVGTISYRFVWSGEKHQTGFIYRLTLHGGGGIQMHRAEIPAYELVLTDYESGVPVVD